MLETINSDDHWRPHDEHPMSQREALKNVDHRRGEMHCELAAFPDSIHLLIWTTNENRGLRTDRCSTPWHAMPHNTLSAQTAHPELHYRRHARHHT
jgi:hypothetical protein